jgi:CspA family cold shock protein
MDAGKLKMWNADRGFGFIADDAGNPDMFLHINELRTAGIDPDRIKIGERLSFETKDESLQCANGVTSAWSLGLKTKK